MNQYRLYKHGIKELFLSTVSNSKEEKLLAGNHSRVNRYEYSFIKH